MNYLSVAEHCFRDVPTGASRVAWDMATMMRDRGHVVGMMCQYAAAAGTTPGWAVVEGIQVFRFVPQKLAAWNPGRLQAIVRGGVQAAEEVRGYCQWEVVHLHAPVIGIGAISVLAPDSKIVSTIHSPILLEQSINWRDQGAIGRVKAIFGSRALRKVEKAVLDQSDTVHVLSEFTKKRLSEIHQIPCSASVIPHWIEGDSSRHLTKAEARQKLDWPRDAFIFFSLRQLRRRYGLDFSIRACTQLPNDGSWRYYIGGQGRLRPYLEALSADAGLSDAVKFLGRVPDEQLALAYAAADAFVLPTLELECFGLIILEALAHGCPVIATDAGAIPEVLNKVQADGIVPAGSVEALALKMRQALASRASDLERNELSVRARRVYGAERIKPIVLQLLEGSGPRHDLPR